jgi:hypothetical protein
MVEKENKGFSKTCYYELLDVDRKADTKTIEKVIGLSFNILGIQESCT